MALVPPFRFMMVEDGLYRSAHPTALVRAPPARPCRALLPQRPPQNLPFLAQLRLRTLLCLVDALDPELEGKAVEMGLTIVRIAVPRGARRAPARTHHGAPT